MGAAVAGALALELAVRFLVELGALQCGQLRLGQDQPFLGGLGFERLQALGHRLEVVPHPDAAYALRRDAQSAALADLVGDAHLAVGRQLQRQGDHGLLDLWIDAVLQQRPATRDLLRAASPPLSYNSLKR